MREPFYNGSVQMLPRPNCLRPNEIKKGGIGLEEPIEYGEEYIPIVPEELMVKYFTGPLGQEALYEKIDALLLEMEYSPETINVVIVEENTFGAVYFLVYDSMGQENEKLEFVLAGIDCSEQDADPIFYVVREETSFLLFSQLSEYCNVLEEVKENLLTSIDT